MSEAASQFSEALRGRGGLLITGEAGTGRELTARAFHRALVPGQPTELATLLNAETRSFRSDRPFVVLDCSACGDIGLAFFGACWRDRSVGPDGLAVTNAGSPVHQALGGTLFLRDVQELAPRAQATLARVLRDGEIWVEDGRGMRERASVQSLVIASLDPSGDRSLSDPLTPVLRRHLSRPAIRLPVLRRRQGDVGRLIRDLFVDAAVARQAPQFAPSRQTVALLAALPWKGNVAELKRVVDLLVDRCEGRKVKVLDVLRNLSLDGIDVAFTTQGTLKEARDRFEREYVVRTLARHRWRMGEAASALGIQRTNLYRKVRQLSIRRDGAGCEKA